MSGIIFVLILRLTSPLSIFYWPLSGGILAITADFYDFVILEYLGWGGLDFPTYQKADKILDSYYLAIEFIVTRRLRDNLAKRLFAVLFGWRLAGVMIFEFTGAREALFFAPNVFEVVFLLFYLVKKFHPRFHMENNWKLIFVIVVIGFLKLLHEYNLHVDNLFELFR